MICGEQPVFPAAEVGCGLPIDPAVHVYRCTDCSVPFHRVCALIHFEKSSKEPIGVNWRLSCIRAEERGDRLLKLLRRLRQALGGRDQDATCDCARCSAIRAFERFIAADSDDRAGEPRKEPT